MGLSSGTRVGPYEIRSLLGVGGMGEVYRAFDPRLDREVAIKILPSVLTNDPDRLTRFAREARLLAAVNHTNIATVHGLEDSGGLQALVMELVEGETLADRLRGGRLPLDEALVVARQIADALEAAHERGIIHRDLKPANIKITPSGVVKVLDFGLAKSIGDGLPRDLISPPTRTSDATRDGLVVGTAAYMSPEQARGQTVDRRTDIWAFGCVLYEMLTGSRAFGGDVASESLAEVLKSDPDWRRLPEQTPMEVRRLLDRCLRKDPARRLKDIGDARLEIDERQPPVPPARVGLGRRERAMWAAAVVLLLAAAAAAAWRASSTPAQSELRLELTTPPGSFRSFAVSPDGRYVVYGTPPAGGGQLWLRPLDSSTARQLTGTARATFPFWSPDGRSIAFFADAQLKRLNLDDGTVRTIVSPIPAPGGGTWSRDGTILYSASPGAPLWRTSADGGEPAAATRFEANQQGHYSPEFLPDGRHFLLFVSGPADTRGVHLGQLNDVATRRLLDAGGPAAFARSTGHLVFVREGKLLAQVFDLDGLRLRGDALVIEERVTAGTRVSASAAGSLVYGEPAPDGGLRQLVWVDRKGQELHKVVYEDGSSLGPALSPDGRRVAVFRNVNNNMDIWSYDVERRTWDRLTSHPGDDIFPLWSTDGGAIAFASRRGSVDLYTRRLDRAAGADQVLLSTPEPKFPTDWSRDGSYVLFNRVGPTGDIDIWVLPLEGSRTPIEVVATPSLDRHAQFSADGRWIAYESDRTGRLEIYVRPFPGPGPEVRVSTDGGSQVRWHPKGTEVFYIAADDRLIAVPIRAAPNGSAVDVATPQELFATNVGSMAPNANRHQYMVSPDGESFVMNSRPAPSALPPLVVIVNWRPLAEPR